MIKLFVCKGCGFWTYCLNTHSHDWTPPPIPDDIAEDATEIVQMMCPVCEEVQQRE